MFLPKSGSNDIRVYKKARNDVFIQCVSVIGVVVDLVWVRRDAFCMLVGILNK